MEHKKNSAQSKSIQSDCEQGGIRRWIAQLQAAKQLQRIRAEVDWDLELSAIARINQSCGGPALLFENIKDYKNGLCTQLLTSSYSSLVHANVMLGLPEDTGEKVLVRHIKELLQKTLIKPVVVDTGPVKENVLQGEEIDLYQFPFPKWNEIDGGRYSDTFCSTITRDPCTGRENIGNYRGQVIAKDKIGKLIVPTQGGGGHYTQHKEEQAPGMPIAIVYGAHDLVTVCASTPFIREICEWDVIGTLQGAPLQLVKCETVPLLVPAAAEVVIEGHVSTDAADFENEGPFSEYPGYADGGPSPKPVVKVTCITHRNKPIMRGTSEGARPGYISETYNVIKTFWPAVIWNRLEQIGVSGITDIYLSPITSGTNVIVQVRKAYFGHAQQIASALWAMNISQFAFKNIIVVEEDIDIRDWEQVEWAIAFRTDPGDGDVLLFGPTFGSPLDPSTAPEKKDLAKYRTGRWTRMLIDATRSWEFDAKPEWNNQRFPPLNKISLELAQRLESRWQELGIGIPFPQGEAREKLTLENLSKTFPLV